MTEWKNLSKGTHARYHGTVFKRSFRIVRLGSEMMVLTFSNLGACWNAILMVVNLRKRDKVCLHAFCFLGGWEEDTNRLLLQCEYGSYIWNFIVQACVNRNQ